MASTLDIDGTLRVKAESDADEPRLVIPYAPRQRVIEQVHTSPLMNAHLGAEKTFEKLKRRVFWEAMKTDVRKVVTACESCQKRKVCAQQRHHEPMNVPREVLKPNAHWHCDIVGPITPRSTSGCAYILVTVDAFTKYVTATAMPNQTARTVAEALVNEVILIHSVPDEITTDNGAQFTSELFTELCQLLGTKHIKTTPYHPQANGSCERQNATLGDMIAATTRNAPADWDKHLKFVTFAYNTSVHRTTKESPFFLTFGRDARLPIDADWRLTQNNWLEGTEYKTLLARRLQNAWDTVRQAIQQGQREDKMRYDAKNKAAEKPLNIGDLVLIQNATRKSKLEDRWKGPYRIVQMHRPNLVLADLKTTKTLRIHIDRVKRFIEAAMLPLRDHGATIDWTTRRGANEEIDAREEGPQPINAITVRGMDDLGYQLNSSAPVKQPRHRDCDERPDTQQYYGRTYPQQWQPEQTSNPRTSRSHEHQPRQDFWRRRRLPHPVGKEVDSPLTAIPRRHLMEETTPRFPVRATETLTIPARSKTEVMGYFLLPASRTEYGHEYQIRFYPDMPDGLRHGNTQYETPGSWGNVPVEIYNTSFVPIMLPEDTIIAIAEETIPPRNRAAPPTHRLRELLTNAVTRAIQEIPRDSWVDLFSDNLPNEWNQKPPEAHNQRRELWNTEESKMSTDQRARRESRPLTPIGTNEERYLYATDSRTQGPTPLVDTEWANLPNNEGIPILFDE